jgi:F0F1-type ATP synthase assembly protein I
MMITHKQNQNTLNYTGLFLLSAWGLFIVAFSFLFFLVGYWIDGKFNTEPTFMLGLFFLALFLGIGKFYKEAWQKRKEV